MSIIFEDQVMMNKVNSLSPKTVEAKVKHAAESEQSLHNTASAASEVCLSSDSKQLEALKSLILNTSELSASRIQFIKEAIAEGRYEIDNDKIANKLLADTV